MSGERKTLKRSDLPDWLRQGSDDNGELVTDAQLKRPVNLAWVKLLCRPRMLPPFVYVDDAKVTRKAMMSIAHTIGLFLDGSGRDANPSLDTLVAYSGMARNTVLVAIRGLQQVGWLYVVYGSQGTGHSNRYRPAIPNTDPRLVQPLNQAKVQSLNQADRHLVQPQRHLVQSEADLVQPLTAVGSTTEPEEVGIEEREEEAGGASPNGDAAPRHNPQTPVDPTIIAKVEALRERLKLQDDEPSSAA